MKHSLILISILVLTACSSVSHNLAGFAGLSFLYDRRDSAAIALDERIEENAMKEMSGLDKIKDRSHFNITSYNGKVLLTGEAETEDVRDIIISNVRVISGVKLVHNEILISSVSTLQSRSEDSLMAIKVKEALAEIKGRPDYDAAIIRVVIENKVVYLMGLVHQQEGAIAVKAVRNVAGIRKIITIFEYIDYKSEKY